MARVSQPVSEQIDLDYARSVIEAEAAAVAGLKESIGEPFRQAVALILEHGRRGGRVVGTGMGKAGIIAQKVCASLASIGTPALFMHPAEAVHGDLGMVAGGDLLLVFSNSGESEEVVRLLPAVRHAGARIIALTGDPGSAVARQADLVLRLGRIVEPCPLRLAPTASTTAMLALGDALALCVLKARGFSEQDYARLHPGGALGKKLRPVSELMRTGTRLPLVPPAAPVSEAVLGMTRARAGAAIVTTPDGKLLGIFTDGDFRRLMLQGPERFASLVSSCMTSPCKSVRESELVAEAQALMGRLKINALPVVDAQGKVTGLLDIQDLVNG